MRMGGAVQVGVPCRVEGLPWGGGRGVVKGGSAVWERVRGGGGVVWCRRGACREGMAAERALRLLEGQTLRVLLGGDGLCLRCSL